MKHKWHRVMSSWCYMSSPVVTVARSRVANLRYIPIVKCKANIMNQIVLILECTLTNPILIFVRHIELLYS